MSNPLVQAINAQIEARSSLSFAEFMALALYHEQGYYNQRAQSMGWGGDFFTSVHLSPVFGNLLAVQFAQCWDRLGRPERFDLVEMGAGQGLLAQDLLQHLQEHFPEVFACVVYKIIEKAPRLVAQQQKTLGAMAQRVTWCDWTDIPLGSITGCFFSNELVDAFPVHQVQKVEDELRAVYIQLRDGNWVETLEPMNSAINDYFALVGVNLLTPDYPEGYRTEVNLNALDWIETLADRLQSGYVLTIDYGYSARRYYSPHRSGGTLQCYHQHQVSSNPYAYPGEQDITAHVDFTALQRQGEICGLQTLGITQQAVFLMALGLGDRIAQVTQVAGLSGQQVLDRLKTRDALHRLIDPTGLGGFGVLVQGKGLCPAALTEPLLGLTMPLWSD
jgi:SAM-dependent MidA family methyltransferase